MCFQKASEQESLFEVFLMAFYQRFEAHSPHSLGYCGDVKHRDSIKPSMQDLTRLFLGGLTIAGLNEVIFPEQPWLKSLK